MMIQGAPVVLGGKKKSNVPAFAYTGKYNVRDDDVVELLESGEITFVEDGVIDVFMVGGGGGGDGSSTTTNSANAYKIGGGGGGGYTKTSKRISVQGSYQIVIGAGGSVGLNGGATSFGDKLSVNGGISGKDLTGTSPSTIGGHGGGSGGGGGVNSNSDYGTGGYDGSNGEHGYPTDRSGGQGQNFTTREFGEPAGKLYAGGGGGGRAMFSATPIISNGGSGGGGAGGFQWDTNVDQVAGAGGANTGGGGGGAVGSYWKGMQGGSGGSGIVCFRAAAELPELAGTWVLNERLYAPEKNFDEINLYFTIGNSRCSRIKTTNLTYLSAYKVISGDGIDIYQFSNNTWKTTTRSLTFETGATASDEFRAWLASNATKQA